MTPRVGFLTIFVVAFVARMAAMWLLHTPGIAEGKTAWDWGWEPTALAQSILDGGSYGNPFGKESGPSSWLTPVYPGIVALCFWLFDGVNSASATAIFVFQSLVSALACALLRPFGTRLQLPQVGNLASWMLALHPSAVWYAIGRAWDSTLVAGGLMWFLVLLVGLGRNPSLRHTAWVGAAYGLVLFINPAPLALLPVILLYLLVRAENRRLLRLTVFLAVAAAVCTPWLVRNQVVLGAFGLRTNFGVEVRVGNNELVNGRFAFAYHPSESDTEFARYVSLGEARYSSTVLSEALDWIQSHKARFAELCLRRAQIFWFGEVPSDDPRSSGKLAAKNDPQAWAKWLTNLLTGVLALIGCAGFVFRGCRTPEQWVLVGGVALFPCVYYITHVSERYRFPMEPMLIFLIAWLVRRPIGSVLRKFRPETSRSAQGGPDSSAPTDFS